MIFGDSKLFRLALIMSFAATSCGKKDSDPEELDSTIAVTQPTPTPEPEQQPSAEAEPAPVATIWVASNTMRAIAGYTSKGEYLGYIDLSNYLSAGSVTSLTFFSKDVLLATLDPGAAGEKIIRIDLKDNQATSINANWYQDATNLNNVSMYKLVKWSSSKLVGIKNTTSLEGITYAMDNNIVARLGNPFINANLTGLGTCTTTTSVMQYAIPVTFSNVTKLLAVASGTNPRLHLYDGLDTTPTCTASVVYTAGAITATHVPTGAAQLPDGKIYVRYQFTSAPAIIRYDYNGLTFTNPYTVLADSGFLNTTVSDRELVALDDTNLLFSNWSTDSINKVDVNTQVASFFIKDLFTQDVNAIAIRPAQ